jgi:hypothetical protein
MLGFVCFSRPGVDDNLWMKNFYDRKRCFVNNHQVCLDQPLRGQGSGGGGTDLMEGHEIIYLTREVYEGYEYFETHISQCETTVPVTALLQRDSLPF